MQKTDDTLKAKSLRRRTQSSTTLSRKYVKQPSRKLTSSETIQRSSSIRHFANTSSADIIPVRVVEPEIRVTPVQKHPLQEITAEKMRSQQSTMGGQKEKKMTAKEIKDQAIRRALIDASTVEQNKSSQASKKHFNKVHFGFGRVMLALSCATAVVLAIVYFVNLNMPDLSLRVAAMQTGINASYPGYVPRGYNASSITSESKKVILDFAGNEEQEAFTLTEEASSWDSNALLNNYVKDTFKENYKVVKEQGLTIYISGSNAAWVNGGVVYKISAHDGVLTNKQICSIATSL